MIVQFCGMSGAGKTTLANSVKKQLLALNIPAEVLDGDQYRKKLFKELGYSKADRQENVLRLAFIASRFSEHGIVSLMSVINPYEEVRQLITRSYPFVKTIYIDCPLKTLQQRDTKGLYHRATLADGHPDKVTNLTGVNDPFEPPLAADLNIDTSKFSIEDCTTQILNFILHQHPTRS